jgi:hypothetical protein
MSGFVTLPFLSSSLPPVMVLAVKIVRTIDNAEEDEAMESAAWRYLRWFYDQMDVVLVPSRAYHQQLIAKGLDAGKLRLFPHGTDLQAFHPSHRDPSFWPKYGAHGAPTVTYVGRAERRVRVVRHPRVAEHHGHLRQRRPGSDGFRRSRDCFGQRRRVRARAAWPDRARGEGPKRQGPAGGNRASAGSRGAPASDVFGLPLVRRNVRLGECLREFLEQSERFRDRRSVGRSRRRSAGGCRRAVASTYLARRRKPGRNEAAART